MKVTQDKVVGAGGSESTMGHCMGKMDSSYGVQVACVHVKRVVCV